MAALNQIGEQTLTVSTVAVALTPPANKRPRRALIYVGGQTVRWRADGTAPTATSGIPVAAGSYINWAESLDEYDAWHEIHNAQFIRDSLASADATLEIAYFD